MSEAVIEKRIRDVKGPRPLLSRSDEEALTKRQRQLLDELSAVFSGGFNHLTMADLASELNCSLRTLYGLASSRDDLVLLVVDRNLWTVGRSAVHAIREIDGPDTSALEAIRAYLTAANMAVANTTEAFSADCESVEATMRLSRSHNEYLIAVTRSLLDLAAETGEISATVDTAAVARVVAGLGADLSRPDVIPTLATSPSDAANAMLDLILRGLAGSQSP